jgi:hypothetical protein
MRICVIAAVVALASPPALASPSCMTQSEARQKFPTQHLWWHGPNRCWDATPSRTQLSKRIKARDTREVSREAQADRETAPGRIAQDKTVAAEKSVAQPNTPQNWAHEGRWREAMSRKLPGDEPPLEPQAQVRLDGVRLGSTPDTPRAAPAPQMNWRDRWIDMPASAKHAAASPAPADLAANAEPIVTPTRVMLALLAVVLTLGFVELVFRKTQPDWRRKGAIPLTPRCASR